MKKILFYLSLLSFISCSKEIIILDYNITSPRENWTYYENEEIYFSTDIISPYLKWYSSIDGFLDSNSHFCKKLSAGQHEISLYNTKNNNLKTIVINVQKKNDIKEKELLLVNFPYTFKSVITGGFYCLSGSVETLKTDISKSDRIIRDINLKVNPHNRRIFFCNNRQCSNAPQKKEFYVINTKNQAETNIVEAELYYFNDKINVYIEKNVSADKNIDFCIQNINNIILPRITDLWGYVEDINSDSRLTILFSSTINKEKKAIGFFNQNDFFLNDSNPVSNNYNPYSNEMDIIYIAIPDDSDKNYTVESISATIAHEMSHAVNFSKKTYAKIKKNEPFNVLETFLDEGLSHLTENLVGFGSSGGNKDFINSYLKNSNSCSFCDSNNFGEQDTIERRGAMSLFLYYLFNTAGGFDWDANKIHLIDKGGISFLQKIITDKESGWSAIGSYFYINTDFLFQEFCRKCLTENLCNLFDFSLTDSITNEKVFECNEFDKYKISDINNLLPYSITKLDSIKYSFNFDCKYFYGNTYFIFLEL